MIERQIIIDATGHLRNERDVVIFAPPTMYDRLVREMQSNSLRKGVNRLIIRKASLSGLATPHFHTAFIIGPDQIGTRVLNELKMSVNEYNGKKPMLYYNYLIGGA